MKELADAIFELIECRHNPNMPHVSPKAIRALRSLLRRTAGVLHGTDENITEQQYPPVICCTAAGARVDRGGVLRNGEGQAGVRPLALGEILSMPGVSARIGALSLLTGLKRSGLAIVVITHGLPLGNQVSDRAVIVRHGAIMEMGGTVKAFSNPRHSHTSDFLAALPELPGGPIGVLERLPLAQFAEGHFAATAGSWHQGSRITRSVISVLVS